MVVEVMQQSQVFLDYLEEWRRNLQPLSLARDVPDPSKAAVFSADMVVGFCSQGNLASPRIGRLIEPVRKLFQRAHHHGIRHFILAQDTHHRETPEFQAFPPHCLRGTHESQTIPELKALPFSDHFTVIEKNSLHPGLGTGLDRWLEAHAELRDAIVVGDCTDLCTYHLAMHLRLRANAYDMQDVRVIVPANAVDTYDLSVESAQATGILAHPATSSTGCSCTTWP